MLLVDISEREPGPELAISPVPHLSRVLPLKAHSCLLASGPHSVCECMCVHTHVCLCIIADIGPALPYLSILPL